MRNELRGTHQGFVGRSTCLPSFTFGRKPHPPHGSLCYDYGWDSHNKNKQTICPFSFTLVQWDLTWHGWSARARGFPLCSKSQRSEGEQSSCEAGYPSKWPNRSVNWGSCVHCIMKAVSTSAFRPSWNAALSAISFHQLATAMVCNCRANSPSCLFLCLTNSYCFQIAFTSKPWSKTWLNISRKWL